MPILNLSDLNVVIAILGAFIVLYGLISVKIKNVWYLGEALPAVIVGIALGPIASQFIDAEQWGVGAEDQKNAITLGVARVVIGVQLVIAGFQLPAKYLQMRWKEMAICLLPVMTVMWFCTSACIMLMVPNLTLLTALVIGSCVTCTDPILSQAIAKGAFADKYVARDMREIISAEAGANDGFCFPFLMLATYLLRYSNNLPGDAVGLHERSGDVGRLGGGVSVAIGQWFLETWLYMIVMSVVYGAVVGYGSCRLMKFCVRRNWIDSESYLLFPCALGLFILGTCGALGTDDLLACFIAGNALNWDGEYLSETQERHDEVNSSVDVLLNFGGFMYIGSILPWKEFQQPDLTGITYGRLFGLGFLVLIFRRLPAILAAYKFMPKVCKSWKEALFMGYYGPIGVGAVFYVEHARHLFPKVGEADSELDNMSRAMGPTVYWLVFFSIIFHGLSIPLNNLAYKFMGVKPLIDSEGPTELRRLSVSIPPPKNSIVHDKRKNSVTVYNRFSRSNVNTADGGSLRVNWGDPWPVIDGANSEAPSIIDDSASEVGGDNSNRV